LYGDKTTGSMAAAISETNRRRKIQQEYNTANGIVPRSARSGIKSSILPGPVDLEISLPTGELSIPRDRAGQTKLVESLRKQMFDAAAKREFERAAELRDAINKIQNALLLE
jgi:excinuclease ABC subunit B